MSDAKPHFYKSLGRFNWAGSEDEWQLAISFGGKLLSELFDKDDEPCLDDVRPSEVVEMISERLERYWINTGREKKRETIAWFREHSAAMDLAWARAEIKSAEQQISALLRRVSDMEILSEQLSSTEGVI